MVRVKTLPSTGFHIRAAQGSCGIAEIEPAQAYANL
jgi:hypothetical protein